MGAFIAGFGQTVGQHGHDRKMQQERLAQQEKESARTNAEHQRQFNLGQWSKQKEDVVRELHDHLNSVPLGGPEYIEGMKTLNDVLNVQPGDPNAAKVAQRAYALRNVHPNTVSAMQQAEQQKNGGGMGGMMQQPAGPPDVGKPPGSDPESMFQFDNQTDDNASKPGMNAMHPTNSTPIQQQPTPSMQPVAGYAPGTQMALPPPPPPSPAPTQMAAQSGGNPIQGGSQIHVPPPPGIGQNGGVNAESYNGSASGFRPDQSATQSVQPLPNNAQQFAGISGIPGAQQDPIDQAIADFQTTGIMSPGTAKILGPTMMARIEEQHMLQVLGPQRLAAVRQMVGPDTWDHMNPTYRLQIAAEAAGLKGMSFGGGAMTVRKETVNASNMSPLQKQQYGLPAEAKGNWSVFMNGMGQPGASEPLPMIENNTMVDVPGGGKGKFDKNQSEKGVQAVAGTLGKGDPTIKSSETQQTVNIDGKVVQVPKITKSESHTGFGVANPPGASGSAGASNAAAPVTTPPGPHVLGDTEAERKRKVENPITPAGQGILQQLDTTEATIRKAQKFLEGKKNDNTPIGKGLQKVLYDLGLSSSGSQYLNTIAIGDLQSAGALMKPTGSRAIQVLQKALVHTPREWDSHKLAYEKITNILENIANARKAVHDEMTKNPGMTGGASESGGGSGATADDYLAKHGLK